MTNSPSQIEIYLNEQRCDLAVLQMLVQILLTRTLHMLPAPARLTLVEEMEGVMDKALDNPATTPDAERTKQMTILRAEKFFAGLRKGNGLPARNKAASTRQS
jgi:hypothetical protein